MVTVREVAIKVELRKYKDGHIEVDFDGETVLSAPNLDEPDNLNVLVGALLDRLAGRGY